MSYDIRLGKRDFNVTYNLAPMFYKFRPDEGIRCIYGKSGAQSTLLLLSMYKFFVANKEELSELNPKNGWGSWSSAMDTINGMIQASFVFPDAKWEGD